ncbi:Bromodomain-domain-containing protein [Clohesyomyces aquaticus]|uniref:Bromodomain-domain-containing protein n=1 Tax=Clohesyomyces aquaticus TaxID=1231657 RepID=A0A1Y1YQU1_9PLEO|nr:Bromodomain-domain-containing protein [Clohesyomyces aquaticus]
MHRCVVHGSIHSATLGAPARVSRTDRTVQYSSCLPSSHRRPAAPAADLRGHVTAPSVRPAPPSAARAHWPVLARLDRRKQQPVAESHLRPSRKRHHDAHPPFHQTRPPHVTQTPLLQSPQASAVLAPLLPPSRRPRAPAVQRSRGMNTSLTAYTHLESLLLFQSLAAYGVDPSVFSRISGLLKKNPHITAHERFESGRLSPDALRNFFLHILKEEIRSERHDAALDGAGQNGEVKGSRKRKAPSPSLPTVQEAAQHTHLIPGLVAKLYGRYRIAITNQIREEEYKYERLEKELHEIERGEWDSRLKEKLNGQSPTPRAPSLPKKPPLLPQNQLPPSPIPQFAAPDGSRAIPSPSNTRGLESPEPARPVLLKPRSPQNGQKPVERPPADVPNPSHHEQQVAPDQRGPIPTHQPLQAQVPLPQQVRPTQHPAPAPRFPPPQPANAAYNASPPNTHRSPYPPQGPPPQNQTASGPPPPLASVAPSLPQPPHQQGSGLVPPPAGVQHPPQSVQQYGANGVPQYNHSGAPQFSPTHQRFPIPYPPGPQSPGVHTPQQQRSYYAPYPGQPPYPPAHNPQMGQPPPPGGYMLPPFQVSPQDPSRAHQIPTPAPHFPQVSTPANNRQSVPLTKMGSPTSSSTRPSFPPLGPGFMQALAAYSTPRSVRTPRSSFGTPKSAKTAWKLSVKQVASSSASRPSVSPIDDVPPPAESPKQAQAKPKATRKSRTKAKGKEKESEIVSVEEPVPVTESEGRQGRGARRAATRRVRPGSIASSQAGTSVRERSRSQSIVSHTETIAADTESQAGYRVKSEPGTSIDAIEEGLTATPSHAPTRRRGGTLQSLQINKRKRPAEETPTAELEDLGTRTVIAPRHFSRMSNPIMNDIGSHKHASTFTTAVKAKDAEGYYDIIKRPTDLKSIQKAITSGAKAVIAASSDTPTGSPGGGGGIVEIPLTIEVMPPKAIVNSAQLEKELMRMFVNAVMFNSGEDGVVEDAKEMSESVERSVSNWRSAERSSGRLEVEDTPVPDEDAPTASKRRKL